MIKKNVINNFFKENLLGANSTPLEKKEFRFIGLILYVPTGI
jgi:hypothetical protein